MDNYTELGPSPNLPSWSPSAKAMPSYYYNYGFISAENIYSELKEEMRSYFNTGILDDTMFPVYTDKALKKLGRGTLKIDEFIVELKNGQGDLPPNFSHIREVWSCMDVTYKARRPNAIYTQETCVVSPYGDYDRCNPCSTCVDDCNGKYMVYYKTTGDMYMSFSLSRMLKPADTSVTAWHGGPKQFGTDTYQVYDIRDNKIHVAFNEGTLYLVYYKRELDDQERQMIPDNYFISEYVKCFIKWKMYEQLYNDVTDETFNQIERKYQTYKQEYNDAYILADAEVKKQTVHQKNLSIKRARRRLNPYITSMSGSVYGYGGPGFYGY